jgi:hypothetical protein
VCHPLHKAERLCSDSCSHWLDVPLGRVENEKLKQATAVLHQIFIPQFCDDLINKRGAN